MYFSSEEIIFEGEVAVYLQLGVHPLLNVVFTHTVLQWVAMLPSRSADDMCSGFMYLWVLVYVCYAPLMPVD